MFSSKLLKASFSKLYTEEEKINLDISVFVFDCFFLFFFLLNDQVIDYMGLPRFAFYNRFTSQKRLVLPFYLTILS